MLNAADGYEDHLIRMPGTEAFELDVRGDDESYPDSDWDFASDSNMHLTDYEIELYVFVDSSIVLSIIFVRS